jgi:hypothetical protein
MAPPLPYTYSPCCPVRSLTHHFLVARPQLTHPPLQAYSPTMSCSHLTFLVPSSLPTCAPLLSDSHRVTSFAASPLPACSPCRRAGGGPSVQMMMPGPRRRSAYLVVAAVRRRTISWNRRSPLQQKSQWDRQMLRHEGLIHGLSYILPLLHLTQDVKFSSERAHSISCASDFFDLEWVVDGE